MAKKRVAKKDAPLVEEPKPSREAPVAPDEAVAQAGGVTSAEPTAQAVTPPGTKSPDTLPVVLSMEELTKVVYEIAQSQNAAAKAINSLSEAVGSLMGQRNQAQIRAGTAGVSPSGPGGEPNPLAQLAGVAMPAIMSWLGGAGGGGGDPLVNEIMKGVSKEVSETVIALIRDSVSGYQDYRRAVAEGRIEYRVSKPGEPK